jgi:tetratricopeptide (TPR) repeat protein
LEQTQAARTAKLGADHPSTFSTQNNLALAYQAAGQLDRAIALFERTLAARTARLGPDHPSTLTTRHDLGNAYQARGDSARAESLLREVLAAREKKLGADHPEVAQTLSALGLTLLVQRKHGDAEPLFRKSLAIWEAKRPDDWLRFNTQSRLGDSLLGQKKYSEAEPSLLAGYEGLKARQGKIPAPDKSRVAEAGERIVRLYEVWGQPEKAREWRAKLKPRSAQARPNNRLRDGLWGTATVASASHHHRESPSC